MVILPQTMTYKSVPWDLYMVIQPQTMTYFYWMQTLAPSLSLKMTISHRSVRNSAWLNLPYMKDIFILKITPYILRGHFRLEVWMIDSIIYGLHFWQLTAVNTWNDIPDSIKMTDTLAELKSILWKHIRKVS